MTLIDRLRQAKGPSRELDWRIAESLGDIEVYPEESDPPFRIGSPYERAIPRFTASIDAALALVERILPDWQLIIGDIDIATMTATDTYLIGPEYNDMTNHHSTVPVGPRPITLAILTALFLAIEEEKV